MLDDAHQHARRGNRLVDAEGLEDDLVLGIVHAGDDPRGVAVELRKLADDEILGVVSGDRDERVGSIASGFHLGATLVGGGVHHDRPEAFLDVVRTSPVGFEDRHLVSGLEQGLG